MDAASLAPDPNPHAVHAVADPAHGTILATALIRSAIDHAFQGWTTALPMPRLPVRGRPGPRGGS